MAQTWLILSLLVACALAAAADELKPPVPGNWEPIPELTDEFDGTQLDATKWWPTNPQWKGRQPALFRESNVEVKDGQLHLTMRCEDVPDAPEGYHTFTSAAVKSKITVLYGYFEARCKPMRSHGSSAFWFYENTKEIWTEIDVFEMGAGAPGKERRDFMNVHVFHTPTEEKHWAKPGTYDHDADLADDFHNYGLLWTKDKIEYLFDGKVIRSIENTHWHQALTLNFDSETMPDWFGLPKPEELPSTFSIESIRSWREAEK